MSKIILQPSGNKDAREHYVDTILTPVSLNKLKSYLTTEEYEVLNQIYPSGECFVWGVTPGGSNITKWNRIEKGDITLFSKQGGIFASGVTTHKLHNKSIAENLWNYNSEGNTWEYVYFLDEIKNQNIPYVEFNKSVGYQENYIIQGFNVLTQEQSEKVISSFDLESGIYIQSITEEEYQQIVTNIELEETDKNVTTKRRLEQGFLKKYLFGNNTVSTCACCGKKYPVSYLITAHIKKRTFCNEDERKDMNVVFPMCKFGCDELFENGYIVVKDGIISSLNKKPSTDDIEIYINTIINKQCKYYNSNTEKYFKWHFDFHINKII